MNYLKTLFASDLSENGGDVAAVLSGPLNPQCNNDEPRLVICLLDDLFTWSCSGRLAEDNYEKWAITTTFSISVTLWAFFRKSQHICVFCWISVIFQSSLPIYPTWKRSKITRSAQLPPSALLQSDHVTNWTAWGQRYRHLPVILPQSDLQS